MFFLPFSRSSLTESCWFENGLKDRLNWSRHKRFTGRGSARAVMFCESKVPVFLPYLCHISESSSQLLFLSCTCATIKKWTNDDEIHCSKRSAIELSHVETNHALGLKNKNIETFSQDILILSMLRKWKSKNKYHQPVKNFNEPFQNLVRAKMASTVWRPIRGVRASLGNKGSPHRYGAF